MLVLQEANSFSPTLIKTNLPRVDPRSLGDANVRAVAVRGEPYLSGFDPNDLMRIGLDLIEGLDGQTMSERYRRTEPNALPPSALPPSVSMHFALPRSLCLMECSS